MDSVNDKCFVDVGLRSADDLDALLMRPEPFVRTADALMRVLLHDVFNDAVTEVMRRFHDRPHDVYNLVEAESKGVCDGMDSRDRIDYGERGDIDRVQLVV